MIAGAAARTRARAPSDLAALGPVGSPNPRTGCRRPPSRRSPGSALSKSEVSAGTSERGVIAVAARPASSRQPRNWTELAMISTLWRLRAVLRLPLAPVEAALDRHRAALGEIGRAVLALRAPDRDVEVVRLVDPLAACLILSAAVHGDPQLADRGPARQAPELRIAGQVPRRRLRRSDWWRPFAQHLPRLVYSVPQSKDGGGAFSPPRRRRKGATSGFTGLGRLLVFGGRRAGVALARLVRSLGCVLRGRLGRPPRPPAPQAPPRPGPLSLFCRGLGRLCGRRPLAPPLPGPRRSLRPGPLEPLLPGPRGSRRAPRRLPARSDLRPVRAGSREERSEPRSRAGRAGRSRASRGRP